MIRALLLASMMVASVGAFAQEGLKKSAKPHAVTASNSIVTQGDAAAVFAKAEKLIRATTKSTAKASAITLKGSAPVTREQVVTQFFRLYDIARPTVKLSPKPVRVNDQALKMKGQPLEQLRKLVRLGAVGNYSPVAAGPGDKLTTSQLGDSLGFFLARIAQITHTASPKWTPALMGDK